ncbi:MAG: VWA domain-containing protein, partial [bacterium]|nr:VWA domain-containing protein [bacterium]
AGSTQVLFPAPVPGNTENIRKAQQFLATRQGGGGTEMMKAIRTALEPSDKQEHIRIVCFLTDGYVGNDMAILGEVRRHSNARVFSFGIGNSVNRFLLDKMAETGRGEVEYVTLKDDGSAAARRFHERVRNPLLTDISIDWGELPVADIYPKRVPDLFTAKPLVLSGRYTGPARGNVILRGKMSGRDWSRQLQVDLPADEPQHDVLATLWARRCVDNLMSLDWNGIQGGNPKSEIKEEITQLGLDYRLMTQFTSFVAVEETTVTEGGVPRRIDVPVEMPEGVSFEGVFGADTKMVARKSGFGGAMRSFAQSAGGGVRAAPMAVSERVSVDAVSGEREESTRGFRDDRTQKIHRDLLALTGDQKVEVEIWLSDTSAQTMAELKRLGFELTTQSNFAKVLIGRATPKQLQAIARLGAVRYIAPHRG